MPTPSNGLLRLWPALVLLWLTPLAGAQAPAWHQQIDALTRGALDETGLPSAQIAVGSGDEVIFEGAYGLASLEHEVAATSQTLYRTASISKWFTGTAAMRLAEQGLLDLDAPVQASCPAFPEKPWPITTRQLLSHTAGVRHYLDYDALLAAARTEAERAEITAHRDRERLSATTRYTDRVGPLATFADDPLLFEPGTGFAYTSFGYRLLGCVIEGAAGRPYSDVLRTEVFEPSGASGIVEDDAWAVLPHRAEGYQMLGPGSLRRASFRDVSENLPAGGHLATATDLVRFAQAFGAGRLVSQETVDVMSRQPVAANGETMAVGYGHGVDLIGGFPGSLGHPGAQAGTRALLMLLPEEGLSIAVMTNANGLGPVKEFAGQVLEIVREGLAGDR